MLRSTCSCILSVISLLLEVRSVFDEDALSIDEYIIAYLHVPVYEGCVHVGEPAKNRWLTPVDGGVRLYVSFFLHLIWTDLKPGNNVTVVSLSNSTPTVRMLSAARAEMDWKNHPWTNVQNLNGHHSIAPEKKTEIMTQDFFSRWSQLMWKCRKQIFLSSLRTFQEYRWTELLLMN